MSSSEQHHQFQGTLYGCILLFTLLIFSGCRPDLSDDPIPPVAFPPFSFNVSLPEYTDLRVKGYQEIGDIGVRGVIVYRLDPSTYLTYEKNCSYMPNEACATVNVHISGLYMVDACCNSTFDFETGNPSGGIAWRPLRQYMTSVAGSQITISDEVVQ